MKKHRIYATSFASVYPHYVTKAEKKGRTKKEVDEILRWLTGYTQRELEAHIKNKTDFETFFAQATGINPHRRLIQGVVCGIRVEDIEEPLMQEIRYLDKLIDELAKGRVMDKILRQPTHPAAGAKPATRPAKAKAIETVCAQGHRFLKGPDCPECPKCQAKRTNAGSGDLPKLGAPAMRAMESLGVTTLAQVAKHTASELLDLHGFGPKALETIRQALADRSQSLKGDSSAPPKPKGKSGRV
ncbi:MAG: DUF2200 family protein [Planctomycetes bacterium]|nr:DUF2200 family protein [Planctomycetota bacterium]